MAPSGWSESDGFGGPCGSQMGFWVGTQSISLLVGFSPSESYFLIHASYQPGSQGGKYHAFWLVTLGLELKISLPQPMRVKLCFISLCQVGHYGDKRKMVFVEYWVWLRARLIGESLQASPARESWENYHLNCWGNWVTIHTVQHSWSNTNKCEMIKVKGLPRTEL